MEKIKLNEGWRIIRGDKLSLFEISSARGEVSLPFDAMTCEMRDDAASAANSFYGACVYGFYKELTLDACGQDSRAYLEIEGLLGSCDVYIGGRFVAFVSGRTKKLLDITSFLCPGALLVLRIVANSDTGKYVGCGIGGGVSVLIQKCGMHVLPYGVRVVTHAVGEKAQLSAYVEVENASGATSTGELSIEVFNEKNRRVAKKARSIKLKAGVAKTIEFPLRIARPFEWTRHDPYLYRVAVTLDGMTQQVPLGIVRHELAYKQYRQNGKAIKLKGAVCAHDNGMLGGASLVEAEYRKLSKLKEIGYHAVRYTECPTDAVLDTLDKLGMLCVVDLFDTLASGRHSGDGHAQFDNEWEAVVESSMRTLRNHPCVCFYSVAANADESYGRGGGYELVGKIVEKIRAFHPTALVTANAFERVPDYKEIQEHDIKLRAPYSDKQAIAAAREKDLFGRLTADYFGKVDVAGYSHLYPRFGFDKTKPILGLADRGDRVHDVFEETDKNPHVVGCFLEYGADFLGGACQDETEKVCINRGGDLDLVSRRKSGSYYKEILLGKRDVCSIVVQDPDAAEPEGDDDTSALEALWNWPRHIGRPIKVVVHAGGDIVALTLDGKSVGRKIAGKFNNYTAVFKTNFYPGKLEAVSYYKGVEHARCSLETVSSQPKSIKMECAKKNIAVGEYTFVDILVVDKEGRVVPFASRSVEVSVSEEGKLVKVGNANPYGERNPLPNTCTVYDGHAVALVRANSEGKMIVKVSGEGLTSNKITIKVKP